MNREGTSGVYIGVALRLLTALALFIDAGVHLFLAPGYQYAQPGTIGQGTLFLLEAAVALLAGIFVLFRGSRVAKGGGAVVLPWREELRYGPRKAGYHGGASAAEVTRMWCR